MAEKQPGARRSVKGIASAVILFGATAFFAVGSLVGGDDARSNPFWRPILQMHDRAALAFGSNAVGNVYIADGMLLRRAEQPDENAVPDAAEAVNRFAANADVSVYMLAVPTSAGIYGDRISGAAPIANEHAVLHDLSAQLSEQTVWIEAESWLSAEKEQYIYYRTDPCWTSYGAYCVYRSAIRRLGFAAVGYDKFSVRHFRDDYCGRLVQESAYNRIQPDIIDLYTLSEDPEDITVTVRRSEGREQFDSYYRLQADDLEEDPTRVFFSAAEPVIRVETAHQNSKDLLLLTDRFGAAMIPFLIHHYHIIDAVNLELTGDTDWSSLTNGTYSQILILCGADTVTAPDGLAKMLNPAPAAAEEAGT